MKQFGKMRFRIHRVVSLSAYHHNLQRLLAKITYPMERDTRTSAKRPIRLHIIKNFQIRSDLGRVKFIFLQAKKTVRDERTAILREDHVTERKGEISANKIIGGA